MFSSKQRLEKRTGPYGIGSKREILANLANFAYDPINYDYFRQLNILDIFLDVLADKEERDPSLKLYAMTGICNSALDKRIKAFYVGNGGVKLVIEYLFWQDNEIIVQTITSLMYLMNNDSRKEITAEAVKQKMAELVNSPDKRVKNLATIFLEDYVTK